MVFSIWLYVDVCSSQRGSYVNREVCSQSCQWFELNNLFEAKNEEQSKAFKHTKHGRPLFLGMHTHALCRFHTIYSPYCGALIAQLHRDSARLVQGQLTEADTAAGDQSTPVLT